MNNGDYPISAIFNEKGGAIVEGDLMAGRKQLIGLTKREYFAGLAMQGILANPDLKTGAEDSVRNAIKIADELLKQLSKP